MDGEPLDAAKLLHTDAGKPRVSVMSIAHLNDAERMFFVCMLLNELIAWMRSQQGTSSLRAVLYMDEVFGYMPPTANPPSKRLFLTLLKQARAYGLGLVLSTQNPVDLDYKGLSNTGTWFIGRLQTERDKARMMDGLEGVSTGERFDRQAMERTIAGLKKRRFLLHNVHEDEAVVFNTRWVMSYLAGPLTRDQIGKLVPTPVTTAATEVASSAPTTGGVERNSAPVLAPAIPQVFVPAIADDVTYYPRVVALTDISFSSARYKIEEQHQYVYTVEADDGPVPVDWDGGEKLALTGDELQAEGEPDASYAECPVALAREKNYIKFARDFKKWVRQAEGVSLFRSAKYKMTSEAGETEGEFRIRLQQAASEKRDQAVAKLRKRYASKVTTLENRLLRAQQAIEREQQQATKKKLDTAVSLGAAILGAVLGRKRLSSSTATKVGTAIKTAGGASKEAADVARAQQTAKKVKQDLAALEAALAAEVDELDNAFDAQAVELKEIRVKPKVADIHVQLLGLAWMPYQKDSKGRLEQAW